MLLLFDVDGVLIHNLGYRSALQRTFAYFGERLGLGDPGLTDADIDALEANSLTVEWDSGPIGVGAMLIARARHLNRQHALPDDLWETLAILQAAAPGGQRPDFAALAERVAAATPPGAHPAGPALALLKAEAPPAVHGALNHLLDDNHNIARAPVMQVFQNLVVGSAQYAASYGLPPRLESEPLLDRLDRSHLEAGLCAELLRRRERGEIGLSLYTARPSLPPIDAGASPFGYTPEAESALNVTGLGYLPAIGYGKLDWFARRVGLVGYDLVKPSPAHCLSSLGAAQTGLEMEALKAAFAVVRGDHLRYPLLACAQAEAHVFEDSASSLRAVARATEMVNRLGLDLRLTRHGIAPAGSPKQAALSAVADRVHPDINAALRSIGIH